MSHAKPHDAPLQVAVAFAGVLHAAHAPEQKRKPERHLKPHAPPSHVDVALAGGTHGVHELEPHDMGETFDAHWLWHR